MFSLQVKMFTEKHSLYQVFSLQVKMFTEKHSLHQVFSLQVEMFTVILPIRFFPGIVLFSTPRIPLTIIELIKTNCHLS